MIILEEPYLSEILLSYLEDSRIPVLKNKLAVELLADHPKLNIYDEQSFINEYLSSSQKSLCTVSEYALDWVYKSLNCKQIQRDISLLKNKVAFREACSNIYNNFYFKEISYYSLFEFDVKKIQLPVVLKPSVGFLSAGVFVIRTEDEWYNALAEIKDKFISQAALFPDKVVESSSFIVESYIKGREFAIDLYFNDYKPVIVNIFEHLFVSESDVSDRLYITNKDLFDNYLETFTQHVKKLNNELKIKDMAIHLELRMNEKQIIPIEANPMRFTGLCLNELHKHIAGKHPLSYFFDKTTPDYQTMWKGREKKTFCFSVFEKPAYTQTTPDEIHRIKKLFSKPLEIRPVYKPNLNITTFVFSVIEKNNIFEANNILQYNALEIDKNGIYA